MMTKCKKINDYNDYGHQSWTKWLLCLFSVNLQVALDINCPQLIDIPDRRLGKVHLSLCTQVDVL